MSNGEENSLWDLVRNAGRPQTFTLWTDAEKNPSLNQATRENRVLTVFQEPTSKHKEFGLIGFHREPHAMYLLFPRALPREKGRVIGLNYTLIDEPTVRDPAKLEPVQRDSRKITTKRAKSRPAEKEFTVQIRRTAITETKVTVKATSRKLAKEEALRSAKEQPFDLKGAALREEVVAVE